VCAVRNGWRRCFATTQTLLSCRWWPGLVVWEADHDVGAAVVGVGGDGVALVGKCDGGDNREPQPGSRGAAARVGAGEALQRAWKELGWEPVAVVANPELDVLADVDGEQRDRAGPVSQGVVDEVAECLLEAKPVAAHLHVWVGPYVDFTTLSFGSRREPRTNAIEQLAVVKR
jgi:hypothetical protein